MLLVVSLRAHATRIACTNVTTPQELIDAVKSTSNTDCIRLAPVKYTLEHTLELSRDLTLLTAEGSPKQAVLAKIGKGSVVRVAASATVNLLHISLTGGDAGKYGTAGYGGGLFVEHGATAMLDGCTTFGNTAFSAGGVYNAGTLVMKQSTIARNTAQGGDSSGGGVMNEGKLTMLNCTIHENLATYESFYGSLGGGLLNKGAGVAALVNCSIYSNRAAGSPFSKEYSYGSGGGVFNTATLTLEGGSIYANDAYHYGGGVYNGPDPSSYLPSSPVMTVSRTAIRSNTASHRGGGVYNKGTLTLGNMSIISDNRAPKGPGVHNVGAASVVIWQGDCDDCFYNNTHSTKQLSA